MSGFDPLLQRLLREPIHARGRDFERVCKWYLRHEPVYRQQLRHVWLWNDWPGRWGPDAGIDLVAETKDGKLWAIQAKAYDPKYTVKKADVDTFLSESGRRLFSYRLLIATTNRLAPAAQRVMDAQRTDVGVLNLHGLQQANVRWPRSLKTLTAKPASPKKPRPHQKRATGDVVKGLRKGERGQLIMACGTGKTLVALWIAERMKSQRTLILVPSLSLLSQTLREWAANAGRRFEFLPVCSDETAGQPDQMTAHVSELGFPATTDSREVAAFLRKRGPRVVFSTYQSSPVLKKAFKTGRVPGFDLAIADEAHRCAGATTGNFATILDGKAIRARRRLFMTATPRIYTDQIRKRALEEGFEIASMDDEAVFGPVLHRLKFSEAIARNLLSDYQVAIVGVDNETYRSYARRGTFVTTDGKRVTDARSLAAKIALTKATRRYNLRRTISFHSRVAAAREFSRTFPDVVRWMPPRERPSGNLWTNYVSGAMPTGKRDNLLGQFRNLGQRERGLLSNARCLGEGVDVPTLDGVAFVDPRQSQVDIVQAVGRAIRKSKEKDVGTIVLPVFLGRTDRPDVALDQSEFKPIWDVLKALRAHDDDLAEELDALRREVGWRGTRGVRAPCKIHFDLPKRVGRSFVHAFEVRLVEQATASWEFWFGLLEQYTAKKGHARVPTKYRRDGFALGQWVGVQRVSRSQGQLSEERIRRLESVKGWAWNRHSAAWEQGFAALNAYVRQNGDTLVPRDYQQDNVALGQWVSVQRAFKSRGDLSEERIRRLESVKGWEWAALSAVWEQGFAALKLYVRQNGDALVPAGQKQGSFALGQWVSVQRNAKRRGKLTQERIRWLESVKGWEWDAVSAAWEQGFSALKVYVRRNGDALVPQGYRQDEFGLGHWVRTQRSAKRRGRLSEERIRRLESVKAWQWDPTIAAWEKGFGVLKAYVRQKGDALVPRGYRQDKFRLGQWVSEQRTVKSRGQLSEERSRRLESVKGWEWDTRSAAWERGFEALEAYAARHGQALVPGAYKQGDLALGQWVSAQRAFKSRGDLSEERIRRLESVRGWEWDTRSAAWERGFAALKVYVRQNGDALVPATHRKGRFGLGPWVNTQRTRRRKGELSKERIRRLESVKGWEWDAVSAAWEQGFSALKVYVRQNGDARAPASYRQGKFALGQWVSVQRTFKNRGKLSKERIRRLESTKGWAWKARPGRRS